MLLTIIISIFTLVIINLLLLKFSCNKVSKKATSDKKPVVLKQQITIQSVSQKLAPTGS